MREAGPSLGGVEHGTSRPAAARVLVLYERGRNGEAALAAAAEFVTGSAAARITVVTLAPQDADPGACVVYTEPFNAAVREQASLELSEARSMLAALEQAAAYESLGAQRDAVARRLALGSGWHLVLVPARGLRYRLPFGAGRRLRRAARCEVRIVKARRRRSRSR